MKEGQKNWFQEYYTEKTRFDIGYRERLCVRNLHPVELLSMD